MKQQTKFSREQQETHAAEHQTQTPAGREFANPEELLRFDAEQIVVPPELAQRLQKSADEPPRRHDRHGGNDSFEELIMSNPVTNYFRSLRPGPRLILLIYTLGFPIGLFGHRFQLYNLQEWLGLSPALVWKGQIWRAVTYGFFPSCIMEWVSTVFWLATLLPIIGADWTASGFISYCALSAFGGALPILLLHPSWDVRLTISVALVFGLLAAWNRFHRNERLVLLGMGEASVRRVVMVTAAVISAILLLTAGLTFVLLAWCGGLAGWLGILAGEKRSHANPARQVHSERGARLEL